MAVRPAGDFKTSYRQDMALLDTAFYRWGFGLLVAALILAPFWLGHFIFLLTTIGIFAIGATGLSLLTGFTGQISLGHAAFMAIGAYGSAVLTGNYGLPFLAALPLSGVLAFACGAIVALPSLRIKGLYLAIATLAFQFLTEYTIIHAVGQGLGAISLRAPRIGPWVLRGEIQFYYLLLAVWLVSGVFAANLIRSRVGLALMAVRDRDYAAQVMGINLLASKTLAFGMSAFYAGLAGSLWAHYNRLISPEHFTIVTSIDYVAMIVMGGLTSIWGPHLGAALVISLSQGLKIITPAVVTILPSFAKVATPLREIVFGGILILLLIWEPGGLAALARKLKRLLDLWPFSY
ncbi:MAG: branched-chain amino acid ABC transporter permease [Armatimonadota bacterium]|nr:branched-chain amino acid ABC transporter permease [Armatimonadota bacterium]MDR7450455.1 branched-chain amino acid ABC transporter permease [Armatimonadota bacterium]MDR7466962.1 branched-chain amino acid ABC transporter permease [Armatimonadota bacterium]MDR7493496.1 branched-chain amino acid ABC transporter permease [Armatimonadota bacterium]MDR7498761.1 branched-chain amino acid ABC transporter permease [Armatimonadota bacterium]